MEIAERIMLGQLFSGAVYRYWAVGSGQSGFLPDGDTIIFNYRYPWADPQFPRCSRLAPVRHLEAALAAARTGNSSQGLTFPQS
jgi:hypothetical protein